MFDATSCMKKKTRKLSWGKKQNAIERILYCRTTAGGFGAVMFSDLPSRTTRTIISELQNHKRSWTLLQDASIWYRCIMLRTRTQRREPRDSIGNGGGGAKNHKKPQKSYRQDGENGRDSGGRIKKRTRRERVLVKQMSTQYI